MGVPSQLGYAAQSFAAPPCGTCSMARKIKRKGFNPPELRTEAHPMGVPWLKGTDLAKVQAANRIYAGLAAFLLFLEGQSVFYTVENPESSMLWQLPCLRPVVTKQSLFSFDMCQYGGQRLTHRSLLSKCVHVRHFEARCTGDHVHKPWTPYVDSSGRRVFATAEEAAYPKAFCQQLVEVAFMAHDMPAPCLQPATSQPNAAAQASSSVQPRGRKLAPVMPEFKQVLSYKVTLLPAVDDKRRLLAALFDAPAGARLISSARLVSENGVDTSGNVVKAGGSPVWLVRLGVYANPEEYVQACKDVTHPFDQLHAAPDSLKKCLCNMLQKGPAWVVDHRAKTLSKWIRLASELEQDERTLHAGMDADDAKVLETKRLLLEKVARDLGWKDLALFAEIREGFQLTGVQPHTGVFAPEVKPPVMQMSEFEESLPFLRPALLGKVRSNGPCPNAEELWAKTLDEVKDGVLEGPLAEADLDDRYPGGWGPVRRFGVEQTSPAGRKLRPVDDFTKSKANLAFGSSDKIDFRALDELVCVCRMWTRFARNGGEFQCTLSCGTVLSAKVHPSWGLRGAEPLVTTRDLKAAYRQLPISPESRPYAVIAVPTPDGRSVGLFEGKALPFGSNASVLHFNRVARLLHRIGLELCLPWVNFYDDFPVMAPSCIADNSLQTMIVLCQLLGFKYSEDKLLAFRPSASVLGIEVDCSEWKDDVVLVRNKPGRSEELVNSFGEVLATGAVGRKAYLSMMAGCITRTRMFSGGQASCSCPKFVDGPRLAHPMCCDLMEWPASLWACSLLVWAKPRQGVYLARLRRRWFIFTLTVRVRGPRTPSGAFS